MVRDHLDEVSGYLEGPNGQDRDPGVSSARAWVLEKVRDHLDDAPVILGGQMVRMETWLSVPPGKWTWTRSGTMWVKFQVTFLPL